MKICNNCNLEKESIFFYKGRAKCKKCISESNRSIYDPSKKKRYYDNNKEEILDKKKEYWENNKNFLKEKNAQYNVENSVELSENKQRYYQKNKQIIRDKNIDRYNKNKELFRQRNSLYTKKRLLTDNLFKIKFSIRSMLRNALKSKGYNKNNKSELILECKFEEFKLYIESKFEDWMNWNNYGLYNGDFNYGWDIDHIIPLASAETEEDIIRLNHHKNLQPLCSKVNRYIKRDIY